MAKKEGNETPLMQQYYATKAKYPDAILLYRMGDFYETFGADAITTSRILGITLTKRSSGSPGTVELAGFPYHAIDTYLPKLVRAGQRVAICEQLEDPKKTKFLVKRGVIELVTPGACYSEYSTDTKSNIFLASVYFNKTEAGLSLLDLSTGEFLTTEGSHATIDKLLNSFQPKEVIYPRGQEDQRLQAENFLESIGDLERLASKIGVGRITPREMNQLKIALSCIAPLKDLCQQSESAVMKKMTEPLNPCTELFEKIKFQLQENAPHQVNKGGVIATGVNAELDELRNISSNGKELLLQMQQREIEATGIPSLKIGFNNVFGYYIEVTKAHKDKAPANWIRKQTLVNGERYITPELKEYEDKILGAEDRILAIETELYNNLLQEAAGYIRPLQEDAKIISALDVLISFAEISIANNYHRPEINDSDVLDIKAGRHPVIEKQLPPGEEYISNDVLLDNKKQQIIIITGPNMAGKSALLRQTALIVIMAQAGCFVPAASAKIGYVDKIFTRVGASDNISQGESTFMVEMNEAANILNNISDRSLVLFDELGRGTSTYDGISIAWAIVEYLHEHPKYHAKTLFATHYHELNEMEHSFKKIKNYNVSVKEVAHKVIFLRKLVKGGSNHSFGIQVGKMAGLPQSVIKRADEILKQLENDRDKNGTIQKNVESIASAREGLQLSFFQLDDPVLSQIRDEIAGLDINGLTPLEALNKLSEIKKIILG